MLCNKNFTLDNLHGVGEKRLKLYNKLGIHTALDLLEHFPRHYIDFTDTKTLSTASPFEDNAIKAVVVKKLTPSFVRKGMTIYKALVADDDNEQFQITIFNNNYAFDDLKLSEEYVFYGKIEHTPYCKNMPSPLFQKLSETNSMTPIYSLTDGLSSKMVITNIKEALRELSSCFEEHLPLNIKKQYNLCDIEYAINNIHFPKDSHALKISKYRLIFDELLAIQLGLSLLKNNKRTESSFVMKKQDMSEFYSQLPFNLTDCQQSSINTICDDMCSKFPMNRLLQGDVGSGKTMVAAAAGFFAFKNSYQTVLMAPTEILATQHFQTLNSTLSSLGVSTALLTGSMSAKQKKAVKNDIALGNVDFIVGTHALLCDDVTFKSLGLVITDEQHRFGVKQRFKISQKSDNTHTLVMSATPIPRTLALIIYGDLDISVLDELPKGRQQISTYHIPSSKRDRAFNFIKQNALNSLQSYIVCPVISESKSGLVAAKEYIETLEDTPLKSLKKGLLHGKLKQADKDKIMLDFKEKHTDLLVSTTVIEVGVDVPNATIMMIENAERFGLSQLHQLRGRVGRGSEKSHCILVSDAKGDIAKERIGVMCNTSDGFKIAEHDLKLRGPGDFFGERQHGLPKLKIADMTENIDVINLVSSLSKEILKKDPSLSSTEYSLLLKLIRKLFDENIALN